MPPATPDLRHRRADAARSTGAHRSGRQSLLTFLRNRILAREIARADQTAASPQPRANCPPEPRRSAPASPTDTAHRDKRPHSQWARPHWRWTVATPAGDSETLAAADPYSRK